MTTLHDPAKRGFASDNYSGIHPEVLAAIAAANGGHQGAYGGDVYTARLQEVMAHHFGEGVEAFPMFNGTGANVVGLQSMLPRWGAAVTGALEPGFLAPGSMTTYAFSPLLTSPSDSRAACSMPCGVLRRWICLRNVTLRDLAASYSALIDESCRCSR